MRDLKSAAIRADLKDKLVLLSGPRQVGKTTLTKALFPSAVYLNYDIEEHRDELQERSWDRRVPLVIFDELHKMSEWKQWLKGLVDDEKNKPPVLVTGSARLDLAKKVGDSLAGRFFMHRLHPFDLKELKDVDKPDAIMDRLLRFGGFPEPYLRGTDAFYGKWKKSHLDVILRQDLLDIETPRRILTIELLVDLLRKRVGSTVSYASLARDLNCDPKSVQRWLEILEALYVVFRVTPHHRNIARSLLKEPKFYFFDIAAVAHDEGARLENLVALALRKELDRLEDEEGKDCELHFLRTKDGREIDFLTDVNGQKTLIEVKSSESAPTPHFAHFATFLSDENKKPRMVQLVRTLTREKMFPGGPEVRTLAPWLSAVDLV